MTITEKLLPAQAELIEYDGAWGGARGGPAAGMTHAFVRWLFYKRINPYPSANHTIVGAYDESIEDAYFYGMEHLLNSLGWVNGLDYRLVHRPDPRIDFMRLGKHATLRALSVHALSCGLERIRGMSFQTLLLVDPPAWDAVNWHVSRAPFPDEIFNQLASRLRNTSLTEASYPDLKPQGRIAFHPPAEGTWLHTLVEDRWKVAGYKCWRMSTRDNVLLQDQAAYVRHLEQNLDPSRWASDIDGHWRTVS